MTKNFAELVDDLKLTEQFANKEQLEQLKTWCETNVSHDLYIQGDDNLAYTAYYNVAKDYFNHFLANISVNILKSIEVFRNYNAIQYAALKGYDCFLALIDYSPDTAQIFDTPDAYKNTPLHLAASGGFLQTVTQLIRLGALGNSCNAYGQFPLFTALILPTHYTQTMKTNKIAIFNLLKQLIKPELLNAVDESKENLAHVLAKYGYDTIIDELLQTHQKNMFMIPNNQGRYPIHLAALNNQLTVLKQLLEHHEMTALCDSNNRCALHYAAMYGNGDSISACCKVYKELDSRDIFGKTPLLLAAEQGNFSAFKELFAKKANALLVDSSRKTILHHAVRSVNKELVEWILNANLVDVAAVDEEGNTALHILQKHASFDSFAELETLLQQDDNTLRCN